MGLHSFCPGISPTPGLTRDAVTSLPGTACSTDPRSSQPPVWQPLPSPHNVQQTPATMSLIVQSAAANPLPSCPPALSGPFPPTHNLHSAVSSPCPGAGRLARSQKAQATSRLFHAEQPWRPLLVPTASQVETPTSRPETLGAQPQARSLSTRPSSQVSLRPWEEQPRRGRGGGGAEWKPQPCAALGRPRSPEDPHPPTGVWEQRIEGRDRHRVGELTGCCGGCCTLCKTEQ